MEPSSTIKQNLSYSPNNENECQRTSTKNTVNGRKIMPNPKWYQAAKVMRIAGIILAAISAACAAATITGCLIFSFPIYAITILSVATVVTLGVALPIIFKKYWKDPKEIERISTKVESMNFDKIIKKYGDKTKEGYIVSQDSFKDKFLTAISSLSYLNIKAKYNTVIKEHPFLSNDDMTAPFKKRATGKCFPEFIKKEGVDSVYSLFTDKILIATDYTEQVEKETSMMTIQDIVKQGSHTHLIFKVGIVNGKNFSEKFLKETSDMSFDNIIKKYGWDTFLHGIAPKGNEQIQTSFMKHIETTSFTDIHDKYSSEIENYQLIPFNAKTNYDISSSEYKTMQADYENRKNCAIKQCRNAIQTSETRLQNIINEKESEISSINRELFRYNYPEFNPNPFSLFAHSPGIFAETLAKTELRCRKFSLRTEIWTAEKNHSETANSAENTKNNEIKTLNAGYAEDKKILNDKTLL